LSGGPAGHRENENGSEAKKRIDAMGKTFSIMNNEDLTPYLLVVGTIRIDVDIKKMDRILRELKTIKALWHIVQTTGGTGIDTEFVLNSLDELRNLVFEKINRIDGLLRTETTFFLNYIKRQYDWGTALE